VGGELRIAIDSKRAGSGVKHNAVHESIADQISESPQPFDLIRTDRDPGFHFDGYHHPVASFQDEVDLVGKIAGIDPQAAQQKYALHQFEVGPHGVATSTQFVGHAADVEHVRGSNRGKFKDGPEHTRLAQTNQFGEVAFSHSRRVLGVPSTLGVHSRTSDDLWEASGRYRLRVVRARPCGPMRQQRLDVIEGAYWVDVTFPVP
jgi:hypothetical protein